MKRREVFDKTIAKLDAPAQAFVKNVSEIYAFFCLNIRLSNYHAIICDSQLGNTFLDSVNNLSESEVAGKNPLEILSILGKNVKKVR